MKISFPHYWKFLILFICILFSCNGQEYDLTVVGRVINADGLCRIPISLIDMLKEDLKINHISPFDSVLTTNDVKEGVKAILYDTDKMSGKVSILVDILWLINYPIYTCVPESKIKIAYSMWESNRIPSTWVQILNQHFDAVVVPDSFLIDSYRDSGVTIPIFELPLCLYLEDFLAMPQPSRPRASFVFGCAASGVHHKNQTLLIQAFAEEFGNSDNVVLRLSSRWIFPEVLKSWNELIQKYNSSNIYFNIGILDNSQYIENMASLDCYVNISKGEGFSVGPREALALGIPCILSNNSAQKTICRTGFVRSVLSEIPEPPSFEYTSCFGNENIGTFSNCRLEDVKDALRDVYNYYNIYLKQAKMGSEWASQFSLQRLKAKYLNLIKPKLVILGNKNEITDDYLLTSSEKLYNKYIGCFKTP